MPNTKCALIRQKVIDRCLSSDRGYSILELMERCNKALEDRGFLPVSSMNTIRADMAEIEEQHVDPKVPQLIVMRRSGRNKYYSYYRKGFSIYHLPMKDSEVAGLAQIISLLSRFEGMPQFEWVNEMMERFKYSLGIEENPGSVVGFDDNPDLEGRNYFSTLFTAIFRKRPLEITYHSFRQDKDEVQIVHPYYLKQYNKRWFLFGWNESADRLSSYAFDRIVEIKKVQNPFIEHPEIDMQKYFDDIIGVSRYPTSKVEPVRISVMKQSWPYVQTKPIHSSQHVVEETDDSVIIEINVIRNYELEQQLMSYANEITVLSPIDLRDKLKEKIQKMIDNYNRCN